MARDHSELTRTPLSIEAKATLGLVGLYFFFLLLPIEISFYAGGSLVTATRLFLILAFPYIVWASLKRHPLRWEDGFVILLTVHVIASSIVRRGTGGIDAAGQFTLEVMVSYFLARTFFVNPKQIQRFAVLLTVVIAVLALLAIPEATLKTRFLHEIPRGWTGYYYRISADERYGLLRASSTFEHPILFGLFCSSALSTLWFSTTNVGRRIVRSGWVVLASFLSLSSSAILICLIQISMIVGERVTRAVKSRDIIFASTIGFLVVLIELTSNRGVGVLIANYLSFSATSGYYRVIQWNVTVDDVMRNPFFGTNFEDWTRPWWLSDSIDNHWLFTAFSFGLPAVLFYAAALLTIVVKIQIRRRKLKDPVLSALGLGWLITIFSLFLGGWLVTYFGKALPILFFYVGMGAAMVRMMSEAIDAEAGDPPMPADTPSDGTTSPGTPDTTAPRYSRFQNRHTRTPPRRQQVK